MLIGTSYMRWACDTVRQARVTHEVRIRLASRGVGRHEADDGDRGKQHGPFPEGPGARASYVIRHGCSSTSEVRVHLALILGEVASDHR